MIALRRLVETGNRVEFGPGQDENYIQNVKSGKKIHMRMRKPGSYILDLDMKEKSGKAQVCVDSGAEKSVCTVAWGGVPDQRVHQVERIPWGEWSGN